MFPNLTLPILLFTFSALQNAAFENQPNFVQTEYHKRGTNSIAADGPAQAEVIHPDEYHEIDCNINSETTVKCRREGNEVYMPFSFVKNYFEVIL